jgi:hypothetical protein
VSIAPGAERRRTVRSAVSHEVDREEAGDGVDLLEADMELHRRHRRPRRAHHHHRGDEHHPALAMQRVPLAGEERDEAGGDRREAGEDVREQHRPGLAHAFATFTSG